MSLSVGYGESIITPSLSLNIDLTGYGFYLERKGENVLSDLKVRTLYLEDSAHKIILLSCDLIGFSIEFADILRKEIAEREGIDGKNVSISCIHTHSGPTVQALRGLGEVNEEYLNEVKEKILSTVEYAKKDLRGSRVYYHSEIIEPIGFNRRLRRFEPIDPHLNILLFKRDDRNIFLTNYACHPVVLGRTKDVSADWPGELVRFIENGGDSCIFFQGFCGDIDPVTNMNRWGEGTKGDIELLGYIVATRVLKAKKYGKEIKDTKVSVVEDRIKLPLQIPSEEEMKEDARYWLEVYKENRNAQRFIEEWLKEAEFSYERLKENPYIDNVPIQGISIGEVKIIGIPGEVFCQYGLKLRERYPMMLTFGYTNGLVGYIPVKDAYKNREDYAAYIAPKIFNVFPFSLDIEDIILNEAFKILDRI
ncbi:MAG: hypothetical protein N2380_01825 [bacterium]|nr:hypothetical protein [bacterium]